jgi:hypothetical protein
LPKQELDRNEKIAAMRAAGMSLQAIATHYGLTRQRVRQIVIGVRDAHSLSTRARNCLCNYLNLDVRKMEELEAAKAVAAALSSQEFLRMPNAGRKTLVEIIAWLARHGCGPGLQAWPPADVEARTNE